LLVATKWTRHPDTVWELSKLKRINGTSATYTGSNGDKTVDLHFDEVLNVVLQ
jgi:hypothetical protein